MTEKKEPKKRPSFFFDEKVIKVLSLEFQ